MFLPIMPPKSSPRGAKRAAGGVERPAKRVRVLRGSGTASQPLELLESQAQPPMGPPEGIEPPISRSSPRRVLVAAASQATDERPFESLLRDSMPELAVVAPAEDGSRAATVATADREDSDEELLDQRFMDTFDGIDWARLPRFCKPPRTLKGKKSWVFEHGYRVALLAEIDRTFWICRYCHQRKILDTQGRGCLEVTLSTSSVITHLRMNKPGHRISQRGKVQSVLKGGQRTVYEAAKAGVQIGQDAANALGNFDVQGLRMEFMLWIVDNNHPLRELETPAFRSLVRRINPEAERALWANHQSVSRFAMRLYHCLLPQVVAELSQAVSKIHISFDGWTTKGGKRGFFGVVAHYADASGAVKDLPIALPQLTGAHTGERIAEVVATTLQNFAVDAHKLGVFVLDNAYANDTAVDKLAGLYGFVASHNRIRCAPHMLNLVGQAILFSKDADAYDNNAAEHADEALFMADWRKEGPLGVLLDVISYIKTPQQHELFANFQAIANQEVPTDTQKIFEPVKAVVTRWNSFCSAFERAASLQPAFNAYLNYHIDRVKTADETARLRGNKLPEAPSWMRSDGLSAADWQVVNDYIRVLRPLRAATKRLEGRGKAYRFGAIYEVIPCFEYLLGELEREVKPYGAVDYNAPGAPEDHLAINMRAAWSKARNYYQKLDDSPYYYAAVVLHPYYKRYCDYSWRDKPTWLVANNASFQRLWAAYRPIRTPSPRSKARNSSPNAIDDAIDALLNGELSDDNDDIDEFQRWRHLEPKWTREQFINNGNPVQYWMEMRQNYPNLSRLAIDVMAIPASSCECERLFSEVGDLLEPKRRKIGSQLLAALQCIRAWERAGFKPPSEKVTEQLPDDYIDELYDIDIWEEPQ